MKPETYEFQLSYESTQDQSPIIINRVHIPSPSAHSRPTAETLRRRGRFLSGKCKLVVMATVTELCL